MRYGWNHPDTARLYEYFCARHPRYQTANEALLAAAELAPGQELLDVGAGTGRTAALALQALAGRCRITCYEPAQAMRALGRERVPQARWVAEWPAHRQFDRVLCGAAIWQITPLDEFFRRAAHALRPGGALVFNIPIQYLCQADSPGGGQDPWLMQMMGMLMKDSQGERPEFPVPREEEMEAMLGATGFRTVGWGFRAKLAQAEYRDWLKIPVLTDALLAHCTIEERAARLDAAFAQSDPESWRWEAWRGWTAWK